MTGDNNIDDLFRDNLFQRDLEFDPKHWESAEKLINAQEKKRKCWLGGKWFLSAIVIGVILIFAGGYFILNHSAIENETAVENRVRPENKSDISTPAEKPVTSDGAQVQNESSITVKAAKNPPENPVISSNENAPAETGMDHSGISATPPTGLAQNKGEISQEIVSAPEKEASPSRKFSQVAEVKEGSGDVGTAPVQREKISENTVEPLSPSISENSSAKTETKADKTSITGDETVVEKTENYLIAGEKSTQEDKTIVSENKVESETTGDLTTSEPEILQKSVITLNKEVSDAEEKDPQSVTENQETKSPLKDRINWLRHVSLGFTGGANVSQGFLNNGNSTAGFSATPIGGIRLAYLLNEQVDIETGVFYNFRGGLNSKITSLTSTDISTNVNYYSSSKTLSLHYLDFPVHLTYKYGKHSIVLGMHYSCLLNMRNEMINTREENGNISTISSSMQWDSNDGRFSSFDLAAIFGYEYSITERLKICGRFNYGLFDVTDDNSFENSVRDKNNQVRIMVDYRFLKY